MADKPVFTSKKDKQLTFTVSEPDELMKFLMAQMPAKSRTTIKSYLAHKQVLVNSKTVTQFNHPLKPGQQVVINLGIVQDAPYYRELKIVFEDAFIIVINKEAGLLSVATDDSKGQEKTAYSILNSHIKNTNPRGRVFVVHRLDRDTSGLMMFAKDKEVQEQLQETWQDTVLERFYSVVVQGKVEKEKGTITSWLKENRALVIYSSPKPNDGQKAISHYRLVKSNENYSLLEVELETGRKNQIRVHMQDLGHPVIGDKKYGATQSPINRLALHARVLSFIHPATEEKIRFETDIPKKFLDLFKEQK
jgi:23S rRNA pseudouridine1911/1915/1917 synthase